jgi:flagellar hook assembly protein FlgD
LYWNHPNPFNPSTLISFSLDRDENVSLVIYDVSGRHIQTLVSRPMTSGTHSEVWDGRDTFGQPVAGGIYFYRLSAGNRSLTKKMILLK